MHSDQHISRTILFMSIVVLSAVSCGTDPERPSFTDGYLAGAEGDSIYYRVHGQAPDTLVVVHGGPGAGISSVWPMVEPLVDSFTLLLYDQRGGGRSVLPDDTLKLGPRFHVEDLEAVQRHFGLAHMKIFAHSFGALLVARYAQQYPQRLDQLLFHSATGPSRAQAAEYYRSRAAASVQSPDTALSNRANRLLESLLEGTAEDPSAACREYEHLSRELARLRGDEITYRGTTCEAPAEAIRYYYRYTAQLSPRLFGNWDFTQGMQEVQAPLLVVARKSDTLSHPMHFSWARALPDARLLLEGTLSSNPDTVVPAVSGFFRGSWPPGSILPENERNP